MPVEVLGDVRAVDEATLAKVCFRVMGCVFSVRNEVNFPVIQWLNIANHSVSYQTIRKRENNLLEFVT